MVAGVTMPIDVKESATRKIGPLPVWAWAGVVAGAVIIARRMRGGGGGTAVTAGTPAIVGGGGSGGTTGGIGADTTALQSQLEQVTTQLETLQESGTANTDLIAQLEALQTELQDKLAAQQTTIAGLSSSLSNATSLNTLQTKLTGLLQQLTAAYAAKNEALTALERDRARYADGIISKTTYDNNVKIWQGKLDVANASITNLNSQIKTTQDAIAKIGA